MIAPYPNVETPSWYYDDMEELEDLSLIEEGDPTSELHGEGDIQGTDDEVGRAWEDLEALGDSA